MKHESKINQWSIIPILEQSRAKQEAIKNQSNEPTIDRKHPSESKHNRQSIKQQSKTNRNTIKIQSQTNHANQGSQETTRHESKNNQTDVVSLGGHGAGGWELVKFLVMISD